MSRLDDVIQQIAGSAVERELAGRRLHDEIRALAAAAFGELRSEAGLDLSAFFDVLVRLAEADPNVAQAYRGHHLYVERLLLAGDADGLGAIRGIVVGNAQSERGAATGISATLRRDADGRTLFLDGEKFYTTGTLYAQATWTAALLDDEPHWVLVPTDAPGVTVSDDWDGFGQRLTGSGSVRFEAVRVPQTAAAPLAEDPEHARVDTRVFQHLYLLAVLVGIGRAALRDAVAFVQGRSRTYGVQGASSPAHDPVVQTVVGDLARRAFAAESALHAGVHALQKARGAIGRLDEEALIAEYSAAQIAQFTAQQVVVEEVPALCSQLFEVGGAQALQSGRALDRHWRNARALASHNPAPLRKRAVGDYLLNGTPPAN